MGITLNGLIERLKNCPKKAQVVFGPGYMGPKLDWHPQRFERGIMLEFGTYAADHNPHLRPEIVPEVTVAEFIRFLEGIPGSERQMWKGGEMIAREHDVVLIGLDGEVGWAITGIVEHDLGNGYVTVQSAYMD